MEIHRCAWCNVAFETEQPDQKFCKRKHADRVRALRSRSRRLGLLCCKPYKKWFSTKDEADLWLYVTGMTSSQFSYQCPADQIEHYHVATDRSKRDNNGTT